MAEETLSQAAIDALLTGNGSPEPETPAEHPKQETPPTPEPEPISPPPPEPVAEVVPEPVPEPAPEPVAMPEPVPEIVATPDPTPELAPEPVPVASAMPSPVLSVPSAVSQDEITNLTSRIQKAEESLNNVATQAGPETEITNRLEALEASVLTICQMQQDVRIDPTIEKIPQLEKQFEAKTSELERELAAMRTSIDELSTQLKTALNQMQENTKKMNDVMEGVKGTWGYDIQRSYECQHCGSKGNVVGLVKCSECGDEDWWGWWSPEYEDDD